MDYERKRRNVNYHSNSCKMYLRHDFGHKCAYCGVIEEGIALIPEVADRLFEKDHFAPQNDSPPNVHGYHNLYYSCSSCNGKKDAITLPLDPCVHDIFSGRTPHIYGGTPETGFILRSPTAEGNAYIAALDLNSRYHIAVRESQHAWLCTKTEFMQLFYDLQKRELLEPSVLKQISSSFASLTNKSSYSFLCGGSRYAVDFANACRYLESRGYKPEAILEENEMDIRVIIGDVTYWGTVRISDSIKECRIKISILRERAQKGEAYGVFDYIPATNTMHFFRIDFDNIDWSKREYRTSTSIPL